MRQLFVGVRRMLWILRMLVRHGVGHALAPQVEKRPWVARFSPSATLSAPDRLRTLFEDIGGTFIKFGQMLALQPDILSLRYCNALFKLLDRVEPFGYDAVERTIREELGDTPEALFASIDQEPLATASVGQVHVAYLHSGEKVAVKVQRPNVQQEFDSDVRLMVLCIKIIQTFRLTPIDWMVEPMSEFVSWTREELDYRFEARYASELRKNSTATKRQYVPRIYEAFTSQRTLVVEFLEGVTLLDYLRARERGDEVLLGRLRAIGFERKAFAGNVIDNFLGDAFEHGIYHADLHPANLIILENSVVGYIDFGITGVMSPYSRRNLMAMTLGLAKGDMDLLNTQFLKLSAFDGQSNLDAFRAGLDALAAEWYEQEGDQRRLQVSFTQVMTDMLNLSRRTNVMPERDIIKYIRSAIAIDGLIIRFEADFHVGRHLEQTCARYLQWQNLRSTMSYDNLLSWSSTWRRLLVDGPKRSGSFIDRLASGDLAVQAQINRGAGHAGRLRGRAVQLGAMVLVLALLITFSAQPPLTLGLNLFTAEVVLALAGLGMLLTTVRRLA